MALGDLDRTTLPAGSVLIIGAGLAGLYAALKLAPRPVFVLTSRRSKKGSASAWAQGGIASAIGKGDTAKAHANDTINAGDGLVDPDIAMILASEGPDKVRDLKALGVPFDTDANGDLVLSLEAAHSRPRVARVKGDLAGKAIIDIMVKHTKAADHITALIGWRAESLLSDGHGGIAGAMARKDDGSLMAIDADTTIMATGGVGGLYAVTTNPKTARGDALGMAASHGALIRDPEFVQFHPTAIDIGRDPAPLATEALRGDGATLVDKTGKRFMDRYHKDGELAPRDEVSRAVFAQIQKGDPPFLDCRKAVGAHFPEHFPTVFEACMGAGIDPRVDLIPIAPAVHYHMGGLATDSYGRTSVPGLYAVGECAAVGVHGANRLASNSLLEAMVFGGRAAKSILEDTAVRRKAVGIRKQPWLSMTPDVSHTLRTSMTRYCGVLRDAKGLNRLLDIIETQIDKVGAANPLLAARMIAASALAREESRGGHFRTDFPDEVPPPRSTYIRYEYLD
ncbi:MAG TPA: L-aspartate oxidase [Hellea balneolensis]|uniref:L-aspartate oxidase n=1 Tax=Hellea balneolensis TaxID=287478 RepID=A0A7C5R114_9PROT|nr:L-aspartate oxidase [Hellea balneolensis]